MRIVLLHTRLSGYIAASLRALKRQTGCEFLIYCWPNQPDAPFDMAQFEDLGSIRNRRDHTDAEIEKAVRDFAPEAILTSGWADKGYLRICRQMRCSGVPVVAGCDTQWKGNMRQLVASATSSLHVKKAIDVLWVTGERQAMFARALGYRGSNLWDGYYACDWEKFSGADELKNFSGLRRERPFFLYVGRYAPEKGLDTLAKAYRQYRSETDMPWRLVCAGSGKLRELLIHAGAEDLGFVQPQMMPSLMQHADAFVLPSRFEPWGVVVQEAAVAGLPLILSDTTGAGVHLLRPRLNGFSFEAGNVEELADCLHQLQNLSEDSRTKMSNHSKLLSLQYTPARWSDTFVSGLKRIQQEKSE